MTAEHIHDALTLLPADLIAETDKKRSQKPRVIPWNRYAAIAACFALVASSCWLCTMLFTPKGETAAVKSSPAETAVMQAPESNSFRGADTTAETEAAAAEEAPAAMEEELCALPADPVWEESAVEDTQANTAAGSSTPYAGMSQPRYLEALPGSSTACFSSMPEPIVFRSMEDLEAYRDKPIHRFDPGNLLEACTDYDDAWFQDHDLLLISLCNVPSGTRPEITAIEQAKGQWQIFFASYLESTEAERTDWHILIETEKDLFAKDAAITLIFE